MIDWTCSSGKDHEHGFPTRLDIGNTSQDHLRKTADNQFSDFQGL